MTLHFYRTCLETQKDQVIDIHYDFCLAFTAPAKLRVKLRAKSGHYRNRCFELKIVKIEDKYFNISVIMNWSTCLILSLNASLMSNILAYS